MSDPALLFRKLEAALARTASDSEHEARTSAMAACQILCNPENKLVIMRSEDLALLEWARSVQASLAESVILPQSEYEALKRDATKARQKRGRSRIGESAETAAARVTGDLISDAGSALRQAFRR